MSEEVGLPVGNVTVPFERLEPDLQAIVLRCYCTHENVGTSDDFEHGIGVIYCADCRGILD